MDSASYNPYGSRRPAAGAQWSTLLLLMTAALVVAGALTGAFFLVTERKETGALPVGGVSALAYPAALLREVTEPAGGQWLLPGAAVPVGDAVFVVDTGNDRLLKLDQHGTLLDVLDKASDQQLDLHQPMAIASDGSRLFIANSLAGQVLVLDMAGHVERVIRLAPLATDQKAPRPIGLVLTAGGGIIVSDADNHRVLFLDSEGRVTRAVGAGTRAGGEEGFNVPGSLALDSAGNVYVVDTLNGRVVKLSPDGAFLQQFGRLGNTVGTFSRPKGVAVDAEGRVFVSDGLLAAIEVFAPDGTYVGMIGRRDPADPASAPLFQAPAGLSLAGDTLWVVDRFRGLIALRLSGGVVPPPSPAGGG